MKEWRRRILCSLPRSDASNVTWNLLFSSDMEIRTDMREGPMVTSLIMVLSIYIFVANVTVQGTRHLVEGTLDPIVGHFILFYSKCLQPHE